MVGASGFTDPASTKGWGVVDFDWSNAKVSAGGAIFIIIYIMTVPSLSAGGFVDPPSLSQGLARVWLILIGRTRSRTKPASFFCAPLGHGNQGASIPCCQPLGNSAARYRACHWAILARSPSSLELRDMFFPFAHSPSSSYLSRGLCAAMSGSEREVVRVPRSLCWPGNLGQEQTDE